MKIFLTGNRGMIGRVIEAELRALGHTVVGYDRIDGSDILDVSELPTALQGCEAVIHLAALSGKASESPYETMAVNLQGTWNVLTAATRAGVKRMVYMSSVNALGVFQGQRKPDYLPLDDAHPCYPATSYAISKRLAEEMCRYWSEQSDVATICLRPPGVWTAETYHNIQAARKAHPAYEWDPYWEYGAFIDVRDLASASIQALTCSVDGFACLLLSAADLSTSGMSSRELAEFVHPDVAWRGGEEYQRYPFCSLIVTDKASRMCRPSWIRLMRGWPEEKGHNLTQEVTVTSKVTVTRKSPKLALKGGGKEESKACFEREGRVLVQRPGC